MLEKMKHIFNAKMKKIFGIMYNNWNKSSLWARLFVVSEILFPEYSMLHCDHKYDEYGIADTSIYDLLVLAF